MYRIIGIDVGKRHLHIGTPPDDPATPYKQYPVTRCDLTDRFWWRIFLNLIADDAIIAAEPTGSHLLSPLASLLEAYKPNARLWHVGHHAAEQKRRALISDAKNDRLDAIAIYLIAADIAAGRPPRGVKPYNPIIEAELLKLRMLINDYQRTTKEITRTKNRINVLAHSLLPAFAGSDIWMRAAQAGHITPAEIKALAADPTIAADAYSHHATVSHLRRLAATMPEIKTHYITRAAIVTQLDHLNELNEQRARLKTAVTTVIDLPPFDIVTRRWRTIPAASDQAIAALHVATSARTLEMTKDEFKAAVGTNPLTHISGAGDQTRTSRKGYKPARTMLYLWTTRLLSPNFAPNAIHQYYTTTNHNIYAARTKLARVLWGTARDASLDHQPQPDQSNEEE